MEYVFLLLMICLVTLLAQRYLPHKWHTKVQWGGVILLISMAFQLALASFRMARIWYDVSHWLR